MALPNGKPAQRRGKTKKGDPKIARESLEDVRGLGAEEILGHSTAECCTEAFVLRPLHQDEQNEQQADQNLDDQQDIDDDGHGRA